MKFSIKIGINNYHNWLVFIEEIIIAYTLPPLCLGRGWVNDGHLFYYNEYSLFSLTNYYSTTHYTIPMIHQILFAKTVHSVRQRAYKYLVALQLFGKLVIIRNA